jgi:hypothetical protein
MIEPEREKPGIYRAFFWGDTSLCQAFSIAPLRCGLMNNGA